jgi:hypothetical protein
MLYDLDPRLRFLTAGGPAYHPEGAHPSRFCLVGIFVWSSGSACATLMTIERPTHSQGARISDGPAYYTDTKPELRILCGSIELFSGIKGRGHCTYQRSAIPAGAVFRSSIVAESVTKLTLVGIGAGPCPVCGGSGHIPDGVFTFVGNTIRILSAPQRTIDELSRLAEILRKAREKKEAPEAVAQKIRDELPNLADLADLLPRTRTELYAFLALIVAVITLIGQSCGGAQTRLRTLR